MEILKWILTICAILSLYYFVEKYAKRNNKDLFNYRIFSRNNCIFLDVCNIRMKLKGGQLMLSKESNARQRNNIKMETRIK